MPDAPAPTTASVAGSSSSAHASSVPMTRPPKCVPGSGFVTEPVARMTPFASISVPSKLPPTLTLASSVTEPWPSMTSMPFFLNRPATPPVSVLMTFLRRCADAVEVDGGLGDRDPVVVGLADLPSTSATRRTAFAGMHA